ncbi:MAG: histidine--tRNA ligase [Candidatus Omnitrophota bacterium]
MYKRVPGTKDILPDEVYLWQQIEQISRNIFSVYNYQETRTPLIEDAGLFSRSLGESTEIVQKQMFLINNKEDTYALRPEGTASIVRSYIENSLDKSTGFIKFYYIGPMFRLERPQKGRLRQFHHVGCEVIGSSGPEIDIEVIALADSLLKAYSISNYEIRLNSLGCNKDKHNLVALLRNKLKDKTSALCEDCQARFERNVLRVLDCKNDQCQKVVAGLDIEGSYLCADCQAHFSRVKQGLDLLAIRYEVSPYLVRGLDYYTRTVFEIKHNDLGSQDAIGAGGRYDNLVNELGGPQFGAIGFAFGVERLLLAAKPPNRQAANKNLVFVITLGDDARLKGIGLLAQLRNNVIAADTEYENKSLKAAMRKANDAQARCVLIIGDDEIKKGVVMLKDMKTGQQNEIAQADLIRELQLKFGS